MQPFSLLLGLGTLAGLLLVAWRAPQKEQLRYIDSAVLALFISLLVSRAFYAATNWSYYGIHPGEIIQVWMGGLSGVGALAGGCLGVMLIASIWKLPMALLGDVLLPLAGTLATSAWLGCWFDRCAYGFLSAAWWAMPQQDEWGVLSNRVPVQLLGSISTLILIWLIDRAARKVTIYGLSATLSGLGISAVIFALSYLRADPVPIWNGLRLEAWGALILMIIFSLFMVVLLLRWKFHPEIPPVIRTISGGGKNEG
jgi:phosphatidylglycerol:prolipoprotein diacylglycerol transferase